METKGKKNFGCWIWMLLITVACMLAGLPAQAADEIILTDRTIPSNATWDVNWSVDNYATVTNEGTINNHSIFNNTSSATLIGPGTFNNYSGAVFSNSGTFYGDGMNNYGIVNNSGDYRNDWSNIRNPGTFNNSGTIRNIYGLLDNTGTINNSGVFDNFGNVHKNSGTINNAGMLYIGNGGLNNYGAINNKYSGELIIGDAVLHNYSTSTLINYGTLFIDWGILYNDPGILDNYGIINNAGYDSTIINPGVINNYGTFISGGTVEADTFINNGTCTGEGTVSVRAFSNAGTLAPGNSPGMLTIDGNYIQTTGSVLAIELASATSYDILNVTGDVSLAGILKIILYNDHEPAYGTYFDFLTAELINRKFDSITGASGYNWSVAYLDLIGLDGKIDTARLTANEVPIPPALWLFVSGILGIIGLRNKQRIK